MANPAVANGHIRLANDLFKAWMKRGPLKERVLKAVVWECWGWEDRRKAKKPVPITRGTIAELTGITDKSLISKLLLGLVSEKVITKSETSTLRTPLYWPNQDYEQWEQSVPRDESHPREQYYPIPRDESHPIPRVETLPVDGGDSLLSTKQYKANENNQDESYVQAPPRPKGACDYCATKPVAKDGIQFVLRSMHGLFKAAKGTCPGLPTAGERMKVEALLKGREESEVLKVYEHFLKSEDEWVFGTGFSTAAFCSKYTAALLAMRDGKVHGKKAEPVKAKAEQEFDVTAYVRRLQAERMAHAFDDEEEQDEE